MAQSDRRVGKGAYLRWVTATGTVSLFPDAGKASLKDEMKTADVTAGADTGQYNIGTHRVLGLDIDFFFNAALGTANWVLLQTGIEGTVTWGWDGTASGKPKGGFGAIIAKYDTEVPFDDAIQIKASFKPQGDYVNNPATAQW